MALLTIKGMDDLYDEWRKLEKDADAVARAMVQAGAEVVKKAWKDTAEGYNLKRTGAMIDSIGFKKEPESLGDIKWADVYPQGKDERGVRNAEKAFINHYGSTRVPRTGWVDVADDLATEGALNAMENIYDQYIATGVVPTVELTPNNKSGKPLR